jgi:hypothetical protein
MSCDIRRDLLLKINKESVQLEKHYQASLLILILSFLHGDVRDNLKSGGSTVHDYACKIVLVRMHMTILSMDFRKELNLFNVMWEIKYFLPQSGLLSARAGNTKR